VTTGGRASAFTVSRENATALSLTGQLFAERLQGSIKRPLHPLGSTRRTLQRERTMSIRVRHDAQCIDLSKARNPLDKATACRWAAPPALSLNEHESIFEQSTEMLPPGGAAIPLPSALQVGGRCVA